MPQRCVHYPNSWFSLTLNALYKHSMRDLDHIPALEKLNVSLVASTCVVVAQASILVPQTRTNATDLSLTVDHWSEHGSIESMWSVVIDIVAL